jgi:peptidoglycan/LPS O-acetylase OafA/YrhL
MNNNDDSGFFFGLGFFVGVVVAGIVSGFILVASLDAHDNSWQQECAARGVAEYVVTRESTPEWRWKE